MSKSKKKQPKVDEEKSKVKKPQVVPECTCHIKYPCRECVNARRSR